MGIDTNGRIDVETRAIFLVQCMALLHKRKTSGIYPPDEREYFDLSERAFNLVAAVRSLRDEKEESDG